MNKVVMIVGPYIGDGSKEAISRNISHAKFYASELAQRGIYFICPHTHTAHFGDITTIGEPYYRALYITLLTRAVDVVLAIPGWQKSEGSRGEVDHAIRAGIPIFYTIEQILAWCELNAA